MAKDYYAILGVGRNASEKDIRRAYRRLARQYHPDLNPGDKATEGRFKTINEAYEVLSNSESRKKYDRFGENWKHADRFAQGQEGPFQQEFRFEGREPLFDIGDLGLGDLFSGFFGSRRGGRRGANAQGRTRGGSLEGTAEITLEEAFHGTARVVQVSASSPDGRVRNLEVKVPPGVDTGSRIRIAPGSDMEMEVVVQVRPHPRFQRKGDDLYTQVEVPLADAVLGSEMEVPTLKGKVALKVPPETQNGRTFRLRGQGMPRRQKGKGYGDLYVTVLVVLPSRLSERERKLFEELRGLQASQRG